MIWLLVIGAFFLLVGITSVFSDIEAALGCFLIGGILLLIVIMKLRQKAGDFSFSAMKVALIDSLKAKKAGPSNINLQVENFHLAGTHYYEKNIAKLATLNPDWKRTNAAIISGGKADRPIYRFYYVNKPVKLIPEPKNPNDKYAVAVYVAGELVGYISREENRHVLDILRKMKVKYITAFIGGGEYKIISADKSIERYEDNISVNIRIAYS